MAILDVVAAVVACQGCYLQEQKIYRLYNQMRKYLSVSLSRNDAPCFILTTSTIELSHMRLEFLCSS